MKTKKISYASTGVQYELMDPVKKLAQLKAKSTAKNLKSFQMNEVSQSRGETAYVWEEKDSYRAHVLECLGSKNLIADEARKITGKTYYGAIAQDTVACAVNDIVAVGAQPLVVNAYFSLGDSKWLNDKQRVEDLIDGWAKACQAAGCVWGGGETPTIVDITYPEVINLAASCVGIIKPKGRLSLGDKIKAGDAIVLIESSGIHANGISLARAVAKKLPKGYATKLSNGTLFGEALLKPTHLYAEVVDKLFESKIDIHYLINITGHGWRKLMRAASSFSYIMEVLPPPHPLFEIIQKYSSSSDKEMYGNFNMGAGFAVILNSKDAKKAKQIIKKNGFKCWIAGRVERGPKQVVIKPKNIVFEGDSLGVR